MFKEVGVKILNVEEYTPQRESHLVLTESGGRILRTEILVDRTKMELRYALGRTNHGGEDGKYGTSKFHVNPYFATVTAIQMSNRRQWIVEIQSNLPT